MPIVMFAFFFLFGSSVLVFSAGGIERAVLLILRLARSFVGA